MIVHCFTRRLCYNFVIMIRQFLKATKIKDAMSSPVITVKETDDFVLVHEKFHTYDIRHIPVVNDAGGVTGLITQHDLYKIHSPRKLEDGSWYYDKELLNGFILKNVMIANPFTLKAQQALFEAVEAMVQFKFGCIPITDNYRLPVGILTRADILKFLLIK